MARGGSSGRGNGARNGDTVGFEAKLWQAADALRNNMDAADMPYLTVGALSQLTVMTPPLSEQHAIARVLGALDDKIELNRRMNGTKQTTGSMTVTWSDFGQSHSHEEQPSLQKLERH